MSLIRSEGSGDVDLGGFYNGVAEQSCKFVDGDGAYLQRTPSSAGNRKMWTTSMWYKRTELGGNHYLFTNNYFVFYQLFIITFFSCFIK